MKPGSNVMLPRSIVTGPDALPTLTIFPSRTVTTASVIDWPLPSMTVWALIVTSVDCANADVAVAEMTNVTIAMSFMRCLANTEPQITQITQIVRRPAAERRRVDRDGRARMSAFLA
jgi:hypothetical protein